MPGFDKVLMRGKNIADPIDERKYYEHLQAREELMFNVLKVMADNRLDAIIQCLRVGANRSRFWFDSLNWSENQVDATRLSTECNQNVIDAP